MYRFIVRDSFPGCSSTLRSDHRGSGPPPPYPPSPPFPVCTCLSTSTRIHICKILKSFLRRNAAVNITGFVLFDALFRRKFYQTLSSVVGIQFSPQWTRDVVIPQCSSSTCAAFHSIAVNRRAQFFFNGTYHDIIQPEVKLNSIQVLSYA